MIAFRTTITFINKMSHIFDKKYFTLYRYTTEDDSPEFQKLHPIQKNHGAFKTEAEAILKASKIEDCIVEQCDYIDYLIAQVKDPYYHDLLSRIYYWAEDIPTFFWELNFHLEELFQNPFAMASYPPGIRSGL